MFNYPMIMLVGTKTTSTSIFFEIVSKKSPFGRLIILTKMETFLKVFQNIDVKVVLVTTNMIIRPFNIKDYEYDNGVSIFCIWKNLKAY